jgi:hypothetical protein
VPDRIVAVPGVPRTLSNKKLEVPIKRILTGSPPEVAASRGSLANPETLDAFVEMAQVLVPREVAPNGPDSHKDDRNVRKAAGKDPDSRHP